MSKIFTYIRKNENNLKYTQSQIDSIEKYIIKKNINISVDDFIAGLVSYNSEYYKIFNEIYPKLTAGSEFIPNKGLDVVELYNDVNKKIKEYGYTGIFVVFDEFSKFLEANISEENNLESLNYFLTLFTDLTKKNNLLDLKEYNKAFLAF